MSCDKCDKVVKALGLCMTHYQQARRRGILGLSKEEAQRKTKDINLWSHHRIRLEAYEELLYERQLGFCALCNRKAPTIKNMFKDRFWPVDHSRDCCPGLPARGDCIRGILCPNCNTKLHKDINREWLERAAVYLGI